MKEQPIGRLGRPEEIASTVVAFAFDAEGLRSHREERRSRPLSTDGAPAGFDPAAGDIAYYAPWGNLAIFHKDSDYARGLVQLGRIASGLEALGRTGSFEVTIERPNQ